MYRTIVVGVTSHQTARRATEHALQGLLEGLSLARRQSIELHVVADRPDRAILDVAERAGADLIVIGNQGVAGAGRYSAEPAAGMARGARCSVLLVDTSP